MTRLLRQAFLLPQGVLDVLELGARLDTTTIGVNSKYSPNVSCTKSIYPQSGGGRGRLRRDHAGFQRCGRHPDVVHIPLLRDWLRRDIGFEGVITADYGAIAELLRHGVAGDPAEAAAAALIAGVELI